MGLMFSTGLPNMMGFLPKEILADTSVLLEDLMYSTVL
jgi:hypothetical protein